MSRRFVVLQTKQWWGRARWRMASGPQVTWFLSGCCHRCSDSCPRKPVVVGTPTQQSMVVSRVFILHSTPLLEGFSSPSFPNLWGFFFSMWVSLEVAMWHSPSCCSCVTCTLGFVSGPLLLTQLHRLFIGVFIYL